MGLVKRTYVDGETVITADNLNDIQDEIIQNASDISTKGTYSKPSGGIPSTDMTTAVQTSLGKADSAYQKPSGGIPSTDLASAVQTSLGKADTAYQKPSGGIPSTDLASAVQTSLEKADTALQSSDIDSTLTVTGKAADAKKTGDEISGVKNTINQLERDVNNRFSIVSSGSMHDINESGIYYLTSAVTDKPISGGGLYVVSYYNSTLLVGKYISLSNEEYNVIHSSNTWTYTPVLSYVPVTITNRTTSSGAVLIPTAYVNKVFIGALITSGGPGFVIRRDASYFTVFDNTGAAMDNADIEFTAYFFS